MTVDVVNPATFEAPSSASLTNWWDGGGSLMCWMKLDSYGANNLGRVSSQRNGTQTYQIVTDGTNSRFHIEYTFDFDPTGFSWNTPDGSLLLNTLYHLAITYNASSTANNPTIWLNGVSQTINEGGTGSGTRRSGAGINLQFGNRSAQNRGFDGILEDFQCFNRTITEDEVLQTYNSNGAHQVLGGRIIRWKCFGPIGAVGGGDTLIDESGNGNNGVLVAGSASFVSSDRQWGFPDR